MNGFNVQTGAGLAGGAAGHRFLLMTSLATTPARSSQRLDIFPAFVLQDRVFQANISWSLPADLYMVSMWSRAPQHAPFSCKSVLNGPGVPPNTGAHPSPVTASELTSRGAVERDQASRFTGYAQLCNSF